MGNTHKIKKLNHTQKQFLSAAKNSKKKSNENIITFILKNCPHKVIDFLPQNTTQCIVQKDCIHVIAHIATEYLPHSKIPYHETYQWMHTSTSKNNIKKSHSL